MGRVLVLQGENSSMDGWWWRLYSNMNVLNTTKLCSLKCLKQSMSWYVWSEVKLLSCVRLFATRWTVAYQASPSMEFSRQEYWNGLPFPSPGDLPNPGIEPRSPTLQADTLPSESPGKPWYVYFTTIKKDWKIKSTGKEVPWDLSLPCIKKGKYSLSISLFFFVKV